ncbi:hypothetical protein D3C81_789210 [compost metagenome]
MIAVTGAARVLARLPSDSAGASFCLASADLTNTKRAGLALAEVGAHFNRSYNARNWLSSTGRSWNEFWVRAVRNSWSSAASVKMSDMETP